jgi:hypothetical protein
LAAEQSLGSPLAVMLAGQLSTGGSVSLTARLKEQLTLLPLASAALQLTIVLPWWKVEPLGGVQMMAAPGQLSLTVAV